MRRRQFLGLVGGAAAWPMAALGQQAGRVRRIGVLMAFAANDTQGQVLIKAFHTGLREYGIVDGQNAQLFFRFTDEIDRLPYLATELVQAAVEVIVTHGTPAVQAARKADSAMPIVFAAIGDPVGAGIVTSLARPGGNVTGLSLIATELGQKRLELLKEFVPSLSRVAILWNPTNDSLVLQFKETEIAAKILNIQLQSLPVKSASEFSSAIKAAVDAGADALITTSDTIQIGRRSEIVKFALQSRLPLMGEFREIAEAGALFSYGPNRSDMWRRAANYVDKILKGSRPADLPVQQPTRFELVINLKTAKGLGLNVPPTLLARADEVFE